MKHCILVKFIPEISKKLENSFIEQIQDIFNGTTDIDGVHYVKIFKRCINRDNRADIMIEIDMDKNSLEEFDQSDAHLIWKREYSRFIVEKTIFDFEEGKPFPKF
ncbi:hypothetical protein [Treponema pectinovorum]|uniref:hypothetical protein n=1 Tax=Treponema pectinovorum TaxID=164 RepID=UPI0011C9B2A6|nr:hypothetical protein [Treponema pectinovorum]